MSVAFSLDYCCSVYSLTLDVKDSQGNSPIEIAIDYGKMDVADYLVEKAYSTDERTKLLFRAAERGKLEVVKKVLEASHIDPKGEIVHVLILIADLSSAYYIYFRFWPSLICC